LVTFFWRSKRKLLAAGQPPANRHQQTQVPEEEEEEEEEDGFDSLSPNGVGAPTWIPDQVRDDNTARFAMDLIACHTSRTRTNRRFG
jgi:hypothetical protein